MTVMDDIPLVVKTLSKTYKDSLLAESEEDIDDSDACPSKQTKLATDKTEPGISMGVIDSFVSEVNTDEDRLCNF